MATWYPPGDFSLQDAEDFLEKDFMKCLLRTKHLYVETPPKNETGYGMFEPIMLCLSWCDFLGALYCGDGLESWGGGKGNTYRSQRYIEGVLGRINPSYANSSSELVKNYRNGLIHGYVPVRFNIMYGDASNHLVEDDKGLLRVDIPTLINDMIASVHLFSKSLEAISFGLPGSLSLFNKGRDELLTNKKKYLEDLKNRNIS